MMTVKVPTNLSYDTQNARLHVIYYHKAEPDQKPTAVKINWLFDVNEIT